MTFRVIRNMPLPPTRAKGRRPGNIGAYLNEHWNIGASHSLYREDGRWYHYLTRFPGALCDANGYVIFGSEAEYRACSAIRFGEEVNVDGGISGLPGYVRVPPEKRYKPEE